MSEALGRLGLPDTPTIRALLGLLDQTVSRLDRNGRILGVRIGRREYVSDLPEVVLDDFEAQTALYATDLVGPDVAESILATIAQALDSGQRASLDYTTEATGPVLHLRGTCMPCGHDEVIWVTEDRTAENFRRLRTERRADLEALLSAGLQHLIDLADDPAGLDGASTSVLETIASFFGANSVFLRRFRGPKHVEIIGSWQRSDPGYSPPGTSRAGGRYFPWAARQLARDPILVVNKVSELGPESAEDVGNLYEGADFGFVWIRLGLPRRPTGIFGLVFDEAPDEDWSQSGEALIGFAQTVVAVVARAENDRRRSLQHQVFESIARGAPIDDVLERVCRLREVGSPGRHCVVWLADPLGVLRPVGTPSSLETLGDMTCWSPATPEWRVFRDGRRIWLESNDSDPESLGAAGERFGATGVELIPLTSADGASRSGVFAVYDTSRLPLDPTQDTTDHWGTTAASLAAIAIERITAADDLAYRATHDSLTGLLNRAAFIERLDEALLSSGPVDRLLAVVYCDIDRFKELNDRLGHDRGDRFLKEVARHIEASTRTNAVVARLGGDEFAILLQGLSDENDAMIAAERIRAAVAISSIEPGKSVSVSIGVAVSGSPSDHADGLLRDADVAMYQAKSSGRDRVAMFDERFRSAARERDRLGRELTSAIEDDEIEVHYQPMIDLADGSLMGFEALARWRHSERGPVPPGEFIAVAEAFGLIGRLGAAVMSGALQVASTWDDLDLHVNLSPRQLETVGYADLLLERIESSGIPMGKIAMEITESALLSDSPRTEKNLEKLIESGVGLVLDDFGTGYASLTYLRRFPFRGIKIDRSFVSGIEDNPDDASIVAMVLALASSLGLEVVAEGVETAGQETRLRDMGCRLVQGFRYSPAVPAGELQALLDRF